MTLRTLAVATSFALAALFAPGCASDEAGPPHPPDRLDYPVAVTADPGGEVVWVTSGNFDLAYRGGAVLAIDVRTNTFIPDAAFEVGSFPGPFEILERDGDAVAGYILSRSDDALYFALLGGTASAPEPACPRGSRVTVTGDTTILRCPESGALDTRNIERDDEDADLTVGEDPYGSVVRKARAPSEPDLLVTAGMADGTIATFTLDEDGVPELAGSVRLLNGTFSLVENPVNGLIYTSSKLSNIFQVLGVVGAPVDPSVEPPLANPYLRLAGQVVVPEAVANDRGRDAAVSTDGTRLYVSYRAPDTVVVVDISQTVEGEADNGVLAKIPVSNDPGDIVVVPGATPADERIYVACFRDDRVDVIDPGSLAVVDTIRTGRGPFGLAYVDNAELGIRRLYVANFHDQSVGVIELDASSPYYHSQVAEIR